MRILVYCPKHPDYGVRSETLDSIYGLDHGPHQVNTWIDDGTQEHELPHENIVANHNAARRRVIEEGYDALLSIEADMIVPRDALVKLAGVDADIVYGLYIWRSKMNRQWSAYETVKLFGGASFSHIAGKTAEWGNVVDVEGLGMGCTLIHRRVLETIGFRLYEGKEGDWLLDEYDAVAREYDINLRQPHKTMFCDDWMLAMDAQHYGFVQKAHLGVVCGHITEEGALWPDPGAPEFYRTDTGVIPAPQLRRAYHGN